MARRMGIFRYLVGTDSHTPMINGLGVLGWGVGGIEAEAAMLGQPMFLPKPIVLGVRTRGTVPVGTTATDLVLTLTQMLRAHGVVGKFVEFFGSGLSASLLPTVPHSRTCHPNSVQPPLSSRSIRYTLNYLQLTGRGTLVDLVDRYTREQGLFRTDADPEPRFGEVLDLDLVPSSRALPDRSARRIACRWSRLRSPSERYSTGVDSRGGARPSPDSSVKAAIPPR